jgi:hypothetical protein
VLGADPVEVVTSILDGESLVVAAVPVPLQDCGAAVTGAASDIENFVRVLDADQIEPVTETFETEPLIRMVRQELPLMQHGT